ncbi:MAG TPA: SGNH/GDSL hydrolase family protein, partial [Gammaproteobacteria bacterium]|nr:SGNH/GDSL hydrolase family protein [Gammaproteobacteria bacterium]
MTTARVPILLLSLAATSTVVAEPPSKGAGHVALGSSFAAGPGIETQLGSCGRSDHNYPHLVAATLELELTDVSCGGATTANILDTPQNGAAPQLAAVGADTALVTVTIGGNDITYSASTIRCGNAQADDRCAAKLDQARIANLVRELPGRLAAVIDAIHAKAPNATIVVVTYPRVVPPTAERCAAVGLTVADADYFAALGQQLEDATVGAAKPKGALAADSYALAEGHGPCAADGDRWVNGAKPA